MNNQTTPLAVTVWWKNYTVWVNIVAVASMLITNHLGIEIDPKITAGILAILNLILETPEVAMTKTRARIRNKALKAKFIKEN